MSLIKNLAQKILKNPLLSGSMFMVVGSNFANFLAYIYHVIFGRLFSPEQYGELASMFSLIGMIASAVTFFSVVVVKFISSANEKRERERLLAWFTRKGILVGSIMCLLFILLTPVLSNFLHIHWGIVILIGPILFSSLVSLIFKAFLQGVLKFKENVVITNIEMSGRLIFGVALVYVGFSVFGAVLGLLLTSLVGVLIGRKYLSSYKIFGVKETNVDTKKVVGYAVPILLSSLAANSLMAMDLVLVKHFFSSTDAGIYASVTTLGKIIFFGTAPVSSVMFPIVSQKHANGENYAKVFLLSLLMTLLISASVLTIFLAVPNLAVQSLYGEKYIAAGNYLFWYSLFIMFFTLGSLVLNFYLSIGKTKLVYVAILFSVTQIAGIWMFHDSLMTVVRVSLFSGLLFFITLLLYFVYETKRSRA